MTVVAGAGWWAEALCTAFIVEGPRAERHLSAGDAAWGRSRSGQLIEYGAVEILGPSVAALFMSATMHAATAGTDAQNRLSMATMSLALVLTVFLVSFRLLGDPRSDRRPTGGAATSKVLVGQGPQDG